MIRPETYGVAMKLIERLGPDFAEDHANERKLDIMGEHDDARAGAELWRRVLLAMREIVRDQPSRNDAEH